MHYMIGILSQIGSIHMSYRYDVCFLIDHIISLKQTRLFFGYFIFLPIKGSTSSYYLAFAYFLANFNLGLFMKVLLNEKECTFLTAAHFIYYFLILFLDFDIFFFFQRISWKNKLLEILVYFARKH